MKDPTPDLAAAGIVALAKTRAPWILANRWRVMGRAHAYVLRSREAGVCRADDPLADLDVLMRAPLDAKDPAALARALAASAVTYEEHTHDAPPFVEARLAERRACGRDQAEARDALLGADGAGAGPAANAKAFPGRRCAPAAPGGATDPSAGNVLPFPSAAALEEAMGAPPTPLEDALDQIAKQTGGYSFGRVGEEYCLRDGNGREARGATGEDALEAYLALTA